MLTKDKKPEDMGAGKGRPEVIPPRPDTPKLFKAALKVTEQAGIEGTFAKLKKSYRPSEGDTEMETQVGDKETPTGEGGGTGREQRDIC